MSLATLCGVRSLKQFLQKVTQSEVLFLLTREKKEFQLGFSFPRCVQIVTVSE